MPEFCRSWSWAPCNVRGGRVRDDGILAFARERRETESGPFNASLALEILTAAPSGPAQGTYILANQYLRCIAD